MDEFFSWKMAMHGKSVRKSRKQWEGGLKKLFIWANVNRLAQSMKQKEKMGYRNATAGTIK